VKLRQLSSTAPCQYGKTLIHPDKMENKLQFSLVRYQTPVLHATLNETKKRENVNNGRKACWALKMLGKFSTGFVKKGSSGKLQKAWIISRTSLKSENYVIEFSNAFSDGNWDWVLSPSRSAWDFLKSRSSFFSSSAWIGRSLAAFEISLMRFWEKLKLNILEALLGKASAAQTNAVSIQFSFFSPIQF
jgi:hypothetical protein